MGLNHKSINLFLIGVEKLPNFIVRSTEANVPNVPDPAVTLGRPWPDQIS